MKRLIFLCLIICSTSHIWSQDTASDTLPKCSRIITELSYYWKLDSLANNGFRLYTHHKFLNCKIDKIDRAYLFEKLGKPSYIQKTNYGTEYYYYYFDIRQMPKGYSAPYSCWYISFIFDEFKKHLSSTRDGDIDL